MSYGMYATVFLSLKNTGGLLCMFMTEKTIVDVSELKTAATCP